MRRFVLACGLAVLVAASAGPIAAAPRDGAPQRPRLIDRDGDRLDDVLERRLRRGPTGRQAVVVATDGSLSLAAAHRAVGAFPVSRRLPIISGFAARLTAGQIRALAARSGVLRIDHDAVVRATMDAARADFGVEAARSAFGSTGAGVNVCILDTGVDADHEQLDSKDVVWQDFVAGEPEPYDDHGHGTHVASIAVGDGAGGTSAARFGGVAPAAGLWAGKVLDAAGSGEESGIVAGIDWCAADPDVDIISMSLGTLLPSDGTDALSIAADEAVAAGKVVIAAAGNSGDAPDSIGSPGAAADAITVGAVADWSAAAGAPNHSEGVFLASFSSRGGPTFEGDVKPDVVSPGVTITAANANTSAGYVAHSGTSMATPFAAGAAALALQEAPAWSPSDLQGAIEAAAEDYGPSGKDPDWGAGVLDVHALAAAASDGAGETTFPTHVHLSGAVPDGGDWTHTFDLGPGDLEVPIAASIVLEQQCEVELPPFGCFQWGPDLDARLLGPDGVELAVSQCMVGAECGAGRQETLHAMPTEAGTYEIQVYAFLGSPNDGRGGPFELDLSTGPVGDGAPPPSMHVGDLDASSVSLSATRWRARATVRVHDEAHALLPGVTVSGRFGPNGPIVTCLTGTNGSCTLRRDLKKGRASIVFHVVGLQHASRPYVAADDHDPDGDSNGSRITVTRP